MSHDDNPYQQSNATTRELDPPSYGTVHAITMLVVPLLTVAGTMVAQNLLQQHWPGIDVRYLCLTMGAPAAFVALLFAIHCWLRGYRFTAVVGATFWMGCGLFAAWITIAFWHG